MSKLAVCFVLLFVAMATSSAFADTLYDNGPINGTTDAWTINFGFVVSDTFIIGSGGSTVPGLSFGAWLFPGDVLQSAEVSITSDEFGGTTYFDQVVNFTQSSCSGNQYGYNVCVETGSFNGPFLNGGTYWLNLQNAVVNTGDPVYWDENSGPSRASENSVGTIPSEAFSLICCGPPPTVPEPGSILLFGTGVLGVASLLRLKMRR